MIANLTKLTRNVFTGFVTNGSLAAFPELVKKRPMFSGALGIGRSDIQNAIEAVKNWGLILGYDLSERLPSLSDVNFVSLENYKEADLKTIISDTAVASCDSVYNTIQVFIPNNKDRKMVLRRIVHELVHLASYREINIENKNGRYIFTETTRGYWNGRGMYLRGINEAVTEISSAYITKDLWPETSELKTVYEPGSNSYSGYVPFFIGLLKKYSKSNDRSPSAVFRELQTGMLTGNIAPLKKLIACFEGPALSDALNMNPHEDYVDKILFLARELELDDFINYVDAARKDGKNFEYTADFLNTLSKAQKE